jgi:hypothetical protein
LFLSLKFIRVFYQIKKMKKEIQTRLSLDLTCALLSDASSSSHTPHYFLSDLGVGKPLLLQITAPTFNILTHLLTCRLSRCRKTQHTTCKAK